MLSTIKARLGSHSACNRAPERARVLGAADRDCDESYPADKGVVFPPTQVARRAWCCSDQCADEPKHVRKSARRTRLLPPPNTIRPGMTRKAEMPTVNSASSMPNRHRRLTSVKTPANRSDHTKTCHPPVTSMPPERQAEAGGVRVAGASSCRFARQEEKEERQQEIRGPLHMADGEVAGNLSVPTKRSMNAKVARPNPACARERHSAMPSMPATAYATTLNTTNVGTGSHNSSRTCGPSTVSGFARN